MLMIPQVHQSPPTTQTFISAEKSLPKPFVHGTGAEGNVNLRRPSLLCTKQNTSARVRSNGRTTPKALLSDIIKGIKANVKGIVTVKTTIGGLLANVDIEEGLDDVTDLLGRSILLELVSAELDPKTGKEKSTIKAYAHKTSLLDLGDVKYEVDFEVPKDFGEIGAILVQNEHRSEMFFKDIVLHGLSNTVGPLLFSCNSWVHSKYDNPQKRVFFTNKSYLPSETPSGLKRLRQEDMISLRGNGQGERKRYDRIYDYDVYNDLGNPDIIPDHKRPVLGGDEHPYPRRCRTGRPPSVTDPESESRYALLFYVPRDEDFSEVKTVNFGAKTLYSALHALVPTLEGILIGEDFPHFTAIDTLYDEGIKIPPDSDKKGILKNALPRLVKAASDIDDAIQFEPPETMDRDKFFWLRDQEFGRQTLAGLNPYCIQLVTEWPLKSNLDPSIYGPAESTITTEIVEQEIGGFMTLDEALKQKKLFMLDYHDLLLPYVDKVRQLDDTTLYASRTLFFLTPQGTLRPLAIELTRPPIDGKPQWKQVFTPCWDATGVWLWRIAKAHVLSHDSGVHQLVSHWLRTHCCTEPYIIATNRQLSSMHPIARLLSPHFRYTMQINALARQLLINAGGIIESTFSPDKYSMQISSDAYAKQWRFDREGLPADLISRGLAVEDTSAPHGLKLTIEDYPFANDGLLIWDAIKQWVTNYVNHYYSSASQVESDVELQAWWTEIRTVGHADKKDEPWWPVLKTPEDLIEIVTTMVWVTSAHHAATDCFFLLCKYFFGSIIAYAFLPLPRLHALATAVNDIGWR
ncbi:hypothetical protein TIFTF001_001321 [Ficus carica]|uniref:Lipoxygenase n=1 Tax=Ficus carica TaxID=3494 RepID=A0AA87YZD7_FICCA|nr:hypothetical protein TIFTF001_001321 [Ficus carica]